MEVKTYDETDLRPQDIEDLKKDGFEFSFIEDVAGDNADLFDFETNNHTIANKLKELGAVDKDVLLDCESSCFYAYFKTKKAGVAFVKKLSSYLLQKKSLLEKAKEF